MLANSATRTVEAGYVLSGQITAAIVTRSILSELRNRRRVANGSLINRTITIAPAARLRVDAARERN
jgi:hypothetical protein